MASIEQRRAAAEHLANRYGAQLRGRKIQGLAVTDVEMDKLRLLRRAAETGAVVRTKKPAPPPDVVAEVRQMRAADEAFKEKRRRWDAWERTPAAVRAEMDRMRSAAQRIRRRAPR